MGFQYPHSDVEFGLGVFGIAVLAAVLWTVSRWLPESAGVPLTGVPLVLLLGWSLWTWSRVRRGG